jgi:hypothetical protein
MPRFVDLNQPPDVDRGDQGAALDAHLECLVDCF